MDYLPEQEVKAGLHVKGKKQAELLKQGDGVEFRRFFFHLLVVKQGDGVEFRRFFFHLLVVKQGDGVEFRRFFFHLLVVKQGDGVEFRRFFFHLLVVMKSHATSSQNRCAGYVASYAGTFITLLDMLVNYFAINLISFGRFHPAFSTDQKELKQRPL